ncbi:MAG: glycosyltransferase [Lachnospiraceae bacterium]|nr:glycosyltransferase [Lachnospiraceae bacterium]
MKPSILFVMNTMGQAGAEMALISMLRKIDPEEYDISLYVLLGQGELFDRIPPYVHILNRHYSTDSVLSTRGLFRLGFHLLHRGLCYGAFVPWIPYAIRNYRAMKKQRGRIQLDKLCWKMLSDGSRRFHKEYDLAVAFIEGASTYYVANHVRAKQKAAFVHVDYHLAGYTTDLDGNAYDKIHQIFAISDEVKKAFLGVHPECREKTKVFHNILDQNRIRTLAKEGDGFTDGYRGIRLLTVGRLNVQKAYEIAIEALALLRDWGYEVRWYALGEGPMREDLERKIIKRGLKEDFLLLGAMENPYPYFLNCDIYVHATRFEGKSIAVQEAQTLGCPIIVSDVNGNREQVEHEVDGLICALQPKAVAEAIVYMIKHPIERAKMAKLAGEKELEHAQELEALLACARGESSV